MHLLRFGLDPTYGHKCWQVFCTIVGGYFKSFLTLIILLFLYRVHINLDVPMYLLFPFLLAHGVLACPFAALFCVDSTVLKIKRELWVQEEMIQECTVNNDLFLVRLQNLNFAPSNPGRILKLCLASKRFLYSFPFTMATDKCFWLKVTPKAKLISLDFSSPETQSQNPHSLSCSPKPPN